MSILCLYLSILSRSEMLSVKHPFQAGYAIAATYLFNKFIKQRNHLR